MASRAPAKGNAAKGNEHWRIVLKRSLLRAGQMTGAILLGLLAVFVALALLGYHESDPSMNTAAGGAVENVMGTPGAWVAGLLLWLGGIGTVLLLPLAATFARRLWIADDLRGWSTQLGRCLGGILLIGIGLELLAPGAPVGLPAGRGGLLAQLFARQGMNVTALIPSGWSRAADWALLIACLIGGFALCYKSWRLERPLFTLRRPSLPKFGLLRGATPPWEEEDNLDETQPTKPRAQVSTEPKPPIRIHPGPVVTLYELEPAPGIKSSARHRLADDIARSMSAISARVAVVPGRNAIGIELPNPSARRSICASCCSAGEFDDRERQPAAGARQDHRRRAR
jgi:S-DNA-T family DNA segregation ATPase FtsK/SpoIIIE